MVLLTPSVTMHQVGCGGNSDRISRHNAIRDVVFNAAQSAALGPSKETPGLVPDSASRPADVLLPNWTNGILDGHMHLVVSFLNILLVCTLLALNYLPPPPPQKVYGSVFVCVWVCG